MLEALLVYLGETQREGRVVTRRLRATIILSVLTGIFFLIAFIAAVVACPARSEWPETGMPSNPPALARSWTVRLIARGPIRSIVGWFR